MSYIYTGAKLDLSGRGLLGFRLMQSTDPQGIKTVTTFKQSWPYIGLVAGVVKSLPGGGLLNQVDNSYTFNDLAGNNPACAPGNDPLPSGSTVGKCYFASVCQSVEQSWDLNAAQMPTVTTTNTFDGYGNATQIVVSTSVGGVPDGYSKTTTNTYTNDTTNWFLGRLIRSTVQSTTP